MNFLAPFYTEIYLDDPSGQKLELLDYMSGYEYVKVKNDVSPFTVKMPSTFNRKLIKLDNIIEIWRGVSAGAMHLDYCGFLRYWEFGSENGSDYTLLSGVSVNDLLRRRIVKDYAGSSQADKTDHADDICKAVVREQLGSSAGTGRDLSSVGGGFTVQADNHLGQSLTKGFAYRNVLEVCREVCEASANLGTDVFFDIVPLVSSLQIGALALEFRTYTGQPGADHGWNSGVPVYVGRQWGNFQDDIYSTDYNAPSYVYVMGAGEGASREISTVENTTLSGTSIWNRCEHGVDARNTDSGDSAARLAEGNGYLNENRVKTMLGGTVIETADFRYGREWNFGDKVAASAYDQQWDALISAVDVIVDQDGERVSARLEVDL